MSVTCKTADNSRPIKFVVGIAEMMVSDQPNTTLITYSLGSCIGLSLHDPVARVGGMIHFMLPTSQDNRAKAATTPCMFGDTGLPLLLQALFDQGARRNRIVAKVAGGASRLEEECFFKIGERNYAMVRKFLWKNSIMIQGEHVGGLQSRTLITEVGTGLTTVKTNGTEFEI